MLKLDQISQSTCAKLPNKRVNAVFSLSMPRNNAWNNKWSGEGSKHLLFKQISLKKLLQLQGKARWYYDFGDGWTACVTLDLVQPGELRKLKKDNHGFLGYDWMVESILQYNKIRA